MEGASTWKRKTEHNLNAILQHMWEVEFDPAELAHFKQWTDKMDYGTQREFN